MSNGQPKQTNNGLRENEIISDRFWLHWSLLYWLCKANGYTRSFDHFFWGSSEEARHLL